MGLEAPRTDYLGSNISSTCNSAGSALWASTKNIKPLIDANCHTEAIELANDRSRLQLSPSLYKNPGSNSGHPGSQTILFGWPSELRTDNKIPPILEHLLHQFNPGSAMITGAPVSQGTDIVTNKLTPWKLREDWPLVHEIEQAWTGEKEFDRALLSKYGAIAHRLIQVRCLPSYATTGS